MAKNKNGVYIPEAVDGSSTPVAEVMRQKGRYFPKGKSAKAKARIEDQMMTEVK